MLAKYRQWFILDFIAIFYYLGCFLVIQS